MKSIFKLQMTFELKMMIVGSLLLIASLLYDYIILDVIYSGTDPASIASQDRHLFVSLGIFRAGFIVILLSLCIKVVKGLRPQKKNK